VSSIAKNYYQLYIIRT